MLDIFAVLCYNVNSCSWAYRPILKEGGSRGRRQSIMKKSARKRSYIIAAVVMAFMTIGCLLESETIGFIIERDFPMFDAEAIANVLFYSSMVFAAVSTCFFLAYIINWEKQKKLKICEEMFDGAVTKTRINAAEAYREEIDQISDFEWLDSPSVFIWGDLFYAKIKTRIVEVLWSILSAIIVSIFRLKS